VLVLIVAVVGLVGFYVVRAWQDAAARAEARAVLLADVAVATAEGQRADATRLSNLMAGLRQQADHETSAELLRAQAAIELARDRAERADRLFGTTAASPTASPADRRLGARILLRRHEGFAGDAAAANAMLQRALSMAELAYADSGDVRDLFRCWQAQKRLGQHASATEVAARLAARHAGSLEAQLVALVDAFDPVQSAAAVRSLATQFVEAPVELEAMRVLVELQGGDVPAAVAAADALLLRAPGIMVARYAAALVFHTCAIALPAESTDRASWLQRRDQQLDWLVERAPADEPQRQAWAALRALR
jgi:hypothetical protein